MMDMEYNRTSPFISNCLHYSSEFHPYVGEFFYLCIRKAALGKVKVNFLSARLHYLLIR